MQAIAVLPQGLEEEGAKELTTLGAKAVRPLRRAAAFEADMACFYRLHLQARLPFRLLREIAQFPCRGPKELYLGVQSAFDWERWLHPSMSFRVDVTGSGPGLTHSHFTALQVKNALVDLQRQLWGERSDIDLQDPALCLHLHLSRDCAVLSLDGSAGSLHRRGYRAAVGAAPLKENLAAGLIRLSGWDGCVPLVDPLCGSGTLLIEAASMKLGLAPGLNRSFLLEGWADFDPQIWSEEQARAKQRERRNQSLPVIIGCDRDPSITTQAKANLSEAGLDHVVGIQTCDFRNLELPKQPGVMVCNPPYGIRVGQDENLTALYESLGQYAKTHASGWQLWLLNGNPSLSRSLQMKASRRIPVSNGGIECRWLNYAIR
ncbi:MULTISPECIES: THUMP domain-containing class I SAM-dependent RNA methyltransferase [Prochlorococcus]|uniref:THUMP domain-containing class I SAM-dependent RNA methyltransferase n=1 Tax=Prochlorococcus TaxID=1218 RepID=UPI0007B3D3B1|nr:RNA methyltransferase [Prochlorococcus marinus]KZR83764.1 Ribosomal RNA large subunit methyltransferase L [Prochlorococcus marinus str. MIT 1327]